jgi:hypothetical protein
MTLTRLLEINSKLLKPDEFVSLQVAERIWRDHGCPTGVRELIELLEKVLSDCLQDGIRYAPILLQRKKALHRGIWAPRIESVAALADAPKVANADGDACSRCGGSGYILVRRGRGATLCPCEAWKSARRQCN